MPGVASPARCPTRRRRDLGVLIGRLPATRRWERADEDLLELFASEMAAAIRNAQLFATVESQNQQLIGSTPPRTTSCAGVSHNLQTPLTSIRAYAEQLDAAGRMLASGPSPSRSSAIADGPPAPDRHAHESGALRPR